MAESLFGAVQIVGPHGLEDHFEDEAGPENVICTKETKRETLEEVELTLTIDHLPLIDTGWEGEPLVLKMTHHLLCFT